MAILSFIFGRGPKLEIGELEIDVSENETHEFGAVITENPIEEGADPTDNVNIKSPRITIQGVVSDTPITFLSGVRSLFSENATKRSFEELVNILETRQPITLATGLEVYDNMVLEGIRFPRDRTTGSTLRFTAVFKQVRIISTSLINLPEGFAATADLGKVSPQTPEPGVVSSSQDPSSAAFKLFGKALGG